MTVFRPAGSAGVSAEILIGDRVRVASEGHEDDGLRGFLSCVDSGALYYVATEADDFLCGPFTRSELVPVVWCEWFVRCVNEATGSVRHPILGDVPTCDRCASFASSPVGPDKGLD